MSKDDNQPTTKADLNGLKHEIIEEVGTMFNEAMNVIGEHFQDLKKDVEDLKAGQNRIENKLDATVARVDDHADQLAHLNHQAA